MLLRNRLFSITLSVWAVQKYNNTCVPLPTTPRTRKQSEVQMRSVTHSKHSELTMVPLLLNESTADSELKLLELIWNRNKRVFLHWCIMMRDAVTSSKSNRKLNACWVIFASGSTTATPPGNTRSEGFVSFGLFGFCRFVQNSCVSGDTNANRREAPLLMILIQSWPGLKMNRFTLLIVISFLSTSLYLWFFTRGLWLGFQHYTVFKTYYGTRADNYHAMYILLI